MSRDKKLVGLHPCASENMTDSGPRRCDGKETERELGKSREKNCKGQ